jgi:hypothetical protein
MGNPVPNRKYNYFLIHPVQPEIKLFLLGLPSPSEIKDIITTQ